MNSADFCKLRVQDVADMLIDRQGNGVKCYGIYDGKHYCLCITLEVCDDKN